jgi:hypothetical protein
VTPEGSVDTQLNSRPTIDVGPPLQLISQTVSVRFVYENLPTILYGSRPYLAGLQMALDLLAEENPKAKSAKPEDFVDSRFIKELDDSGYIDNLYKAKPR